MLIRKISIIVSIFTILINNASYSMGKTEVLDIIHRCETWVNEKSDIDNSQQHVTACQKHNILSKLSKKYGNKALIPNVVYGNFITIFDNQMHKSWMYDNKRTTKLKHRNQQKEFRSNLINIIKIMESS